MSSGSLIGNFRWNSGEFHGDLMGFDGDLVGFIGDLMGFDGIFGEIYTSKYGD